VSTVLRRGGLILAVLAATFVAPLAAEAQTGALTVPVGTGESGYAVNLFPDLTITIETGSTLNFTNPWFEPHTVTFPGAQPLPPPSDPNAPVPTHPGQSVSYDGTEYVSSGYLFRDETFSLGFAAAGTHEFFCIIHPGMQGVVEVVAPGSEALTTQAEIDTAAAQTFTPALEALKAAAAAEVAEGISRATNADGSSTWTIDVGGLVGPSDLQQFFPASLDVAVGDTVEWHSAVPTPHTATFLGGDEFPVPPTPENPLVLQPTPPPADGYTGVGYLNSGIIGLGWPAGQTYAVTFAAPGAFPYLCVLHADQGMAGVINVAGTQGPAPAPPPAPAPAPAQTGSGGTAAEAGAAPAPAQAALVLLAVTLLAGARRTATRTRP
jgi:plastocyanin